MGRGVEAPMSDPMKNPLAYAGERIIEIVDQHRDDLPAVIIVVKGGVVAEVLGTRPIEVFILDYDAHPYAPTVDQLADELADDDEFTPLYTNEVQDAMKRHLAKFDLPQT